MDCSINGLQRLFQLFFDAVGESEESFIGQRTFRLSLAQYDVRDVVLMQRLFSEFRSETYADKIDYRMFLRILCSVNEAPVQDKIALLFDIWDVDASGTLTHLELGPVLIAGTPTHQAAFVSALFDKVWHQIKAIESKEGASVSTVGKRVGKSEVRKEDLILACLKVPSVNDFLCRVLVMQPPKAADSHVAFRTRLKQLQAELLKESMNGPDGMDASNEGARVDGSGGYTGIVSHSVLGSNLRPSKSQPHLKKADSKLVKEHRHKSSSLLPPIK